MHVCLGGTNAQSMGVRAEPAWYEFSNTCGRLILAVGFNNQPGVDPQIEVHVVNYSIHL